MLWIVPFVVWRFLLAVGLVGVKENGERDSWKCSRRSLRDGRTQRSDHCFASWFSHNQIWFCFGRNTSLSEKHHCKKVTLTLSNLCRSKKKLSVDERFYFLFLTKRNQSAVDQKEESVLKRKEDALVALKDELGDILDDLETRLPSELSDVSSKCRY